MLKGKDFAAGNRVIALGLNDRSSDPQKTPVRNLKMIAEQPNLDLINRSLGHCDCATVTPKLQPQRFKIDINDPTGIFWREDTENGMLNHWLNLLPLL